MSRLIVIALAVALLAPAALALDALPDEARFGEREASVVVRAEAGAPLHVVTDAPALVALAGDAFTPTPARLVVPANASWHGLPGVVELLLRRNDGANATRIDVDDGGGTGASFSWPAMHEAARRVPGVGVGGLAAVGLVVGCLRRR